MPLKNKTYRTAKKTLPSRTASKLRKMSQIDEDLRMNKMKFPPYKKMDDKLNDYVVGEIKKKRRASPSQVKWNRSKKK